MSDMDEKRTQRYTERLSQRHPGVVEALQHQSSVAVADAYMVCMDTVRMWRVLTGIRQDPVAKLDAKYPGVEQALRQQTVAEVAAQYGVTRTSVYQWRRLFGI